MGKNRFCPNCGSENVEPYTSNLGLEFGDDNTNSWVCRECGYEGIMPSGSEKEKASLEFEAEGNPNQQSALDRMTHANNMMSLLGFGLLFIILAAIFITSKV